MDRSSHIRARLPRGPVSAGARLLATARRLAPALVLAPLVAVAMLGCRSETTAPQKDEPAPNTAGAATPQPQLGPLAAGEGWNSDQIDWQPYDAGLARAKAENKPICVVLSTTWCPHCKNFSKVFDDPRVVEQAKSFVMIHLDADKDSDIAGKLAKDGGYIPRTFFLAANGTPDFDIHAPRDKYAYFYDEKNPASLLGGMTQALKKLRN